jgi:hypothetical protein
MPRYLDESLPVATRCGMAADHYARDLDWDAHSRGELVWTTAGLDVAGIDAPHDLAVGAYTHLVSRDLAGPIVAVPGRTDRWVFLVEPPPRRPLAGLLAVLADFGAHCLRRGTELDLPPTRVPGGELSWVRQPEPGGLLLPRFSTVAAALVNASLSGLRC